VELIAANSGLTNAKADELMAYADSIPAVAAYPLHRPLFTLAGDSITFGTVAGVNPYYTWAHTFLRNMRATYDVEIANVGVIGAGCSGWGSTLAPYYDAARVRNVAIFSAGTNDFVGAGANAATIEANYWASCDAIRALGYQVIAATILPRGGLFGGAGATEASCEAVRATLNAAIIANWHSHADGLADVTTLPMGAPGASGGTLPNTWYTADGVHPTEAGHAALETVYRAAAIALLASDEPAPEAPPEARMLTLERVLDWTSSPRVYLFSLKTPGSVVVDQSGAPDGTMTFDDGSYVVFDDGSYVLDA
jgi:lysophospholipase L1-like esterase